ncbi:MAG: hypothetical protein WDM80_03835 [Limisphaerales bacterium]
MSAKRETRKQLAALPFGRKLEMVEMMRDRSLLLTPKLEKLEMKKVIQAEPQTPK